MSDPNEVQVQHTEGEGQNLGEALDNVKHHAEQILHWLERVGVGLKPGGTVHADSGDNGPPPPPPKDPK